MPVMTTLRDTCAFLDRFAPPSLAEDWDNVGLLVGDPAREIRRVMLCLTITPASAAEAVAERADLIVTHHPLPFAR
jgi:putative NIF3 family GTP cyclohydrolase 1 type 2